MPPDPRLKQPSQPPPWRIAIAGGGVAGLSLALALKQALGEAVEANVFDPALGRDPGGDRRAFALAAGVRRMLQALGVWDGIDAGAQPILDMVVPHTRLADPVRPVFLTFGGAVEPGEPFAHMVESGALTAALLHACRAAGVGLRPIGWRGFALGREAITVERADGGASEEAALLVAADGARSRLR